MKKEDIEVVVEEENKNKISFIKVFLYTLFIMFTLVGVFFMATYIRWNAEISGKHEIIYYGQEEVKVDKLYDFYGVEVSPELKEDEAIHIYCTSEYGKECIISDDLNVLENNFKSPLLVISMISFIDLIIVYILVKERLNGKKRSYVYGALIILWGLFNICVSVYQIADYYNLYKKGEVITGSKIAYVRTDSKKRYIPLVSYVVKNTQTEEEKEMKVLLENYSIKGTFNKEDITLYKSRVKNSNIVTPKRDMKRFITPITTGLLIVVIGFVYLTINSRFSKKELKEEKNKK